MKTKYILGALMPALAACGSQVEFAAGNADQHNPEVLVDQEFSTTNIANGSVSFKPLFGTIERRLQLLEGAPGLATFKQNERELATASYQQGYTGDAWSEEFAISDVGKLDLLVVIDNSGSMFDEQANLGSKLSSLTKFLVSTDWQMAVVTTDNSCLRNGRTIKKNDPDADKAFAEAINAGTEGSGDENGIFTAYRAFQGICDTGNSQWVRSDAALAVLFVSDEDSHCGGGPNESDCMAGELPRDLVNLMKSMRPMENLKAYGLTWSRDDRNSNNQRICQNNSNGESEGRRYRDVIDALGGIRRSICLEDYSEALESISKNVARQVKYEFQLRHPPELHTINVSIDGQASHDFEITGNMLKLKKVTGEQAKLAVSYLYGSQPMFDKIPLAELPADGTLSIKINGEEQDEHAVMIDTEKKILEFMHTPPEKSKVEVSYRKDQPLVSGFDLDGLPILGDISTVAINGQETHDYVYDRETGSLTFDTPPIDGALVDVTYRPIGAPVTEYEMRHVEIEGLKSISIRDAESGQTIAADVDDNRLSFPIEEVRGGREVILSMFYGGPGDSLEFSLPKDPLPGSVSAIAKTPEQQACIENLTANGRSVTFQCNQDRLDEVQLNYSYLQPPITSFTMSNIPTNRKLHWQVFVDGAAVNGYTVNGNTVTVPAAMLLPGSKVRILVVSALN